MSVFPSIQLFVWTASPDTHSHLSQCWWYLLLSLSPTKPAWLARGEVNSRGLTLWAMTLFTVMAFVLSKDQRLGGKKGGGRGRERKLFTVDLVRSFQKCLWEIRCLSCTFDHLTLKSWWESLEKDLKRRGNNHSWVRTAGEERTRKVPGLTGFWFIFFL